MFSEFLDVFLFDGIGMRNGVGVDDVDYIWFGFDVFFGGDMMNGFV